MEDKIIKFKTSIVDGIFIIPHKEAIGFNNDYSSGFINATDINGDYFEIDLPSNTYVMVGILDEVFNAPYGRDMMSGLLGDVEEPLNEFKNLAKDSGLIDENNKQLYGNVLILIENER